MSRNNNYAKSINFGKSINQNINRTTDPQNPLTSCIFPTLGSIFLHGASASRIRPYCEECQNYMADRCSGMYDNSETWDNKCNLYMAVNTETSRPNTGAINNTAAAIQPQWRLPRTTGENLLRNSLERRYILYPDSNITLQQFDPNIPNSPYYRRSCSMSSNWKVKNIDGSTVDKDPLMNAALDNYSACTDVFAIIWHAWKNKKLQISGTRLERNLQDNSALYNDIYGRIVRNTSRNQEQNPCILAAKPQMASSELIPGYKKGIPKCHK